MTLRSFLFPDYPAGRLGWALLLLRVAAGLAFFLHGAQKMAQPSSWMGRDAWAPGFLQFLAAFSECFGGLAWVIGLLTPLAALGIGITMTVASFSHLVARGDPFVKLPGAPDVAAPLYGLPTALVRAGGPGGSAELAIVFLSIAIVLMMLGPGAWSLDAKLFGRRAASDEVPERRPPAPAPEVAPGGYRVRPRG